MIGGGSGPVGIHQPLQRIPGVAILLRATAQLPKPQTHQTAYEPSQPSKAGRHRVVVQPPVEHTTQPAGRLRLGAVSPAAQNLRNALQGPRHSLRRRLASQLEPTVPVLRAIVRETQEIERLRLALTPAAAIRHRKPPELDETSLSGMQFQIKASEPRLQGLQEPLRVAPVLKPRHPQM